METEEAILTRRSVRRFKRVKVEWDKIGRVLEAGRSAPSAGNIQNWMFIVVDDENNGEHHELTTHEVAIEVVTPVSVFADSV